MIQMAPPKEVIFHVWANHLYVMYTYEPFYSPMKAAIDPLPHQISAVATIVNMNPIRVLLADEVGLGKTITTGMVISELLARNRISRVLIVSPKAIIHQWIRELKEKFGLDAVELTRDNLFQSHKLAVISMDLAKKSDVLEVLLNFKWDLLVIDEAHKLTVNPKGSTIELTQRYKMAEKLTQVIPNVIMLTATPHNGIRVDFAYRLRLLDPSICSGLSEITDTCLQSSARRLLIRRSKEEVISIDGKPLFPPRYINRIPVHLREDEKWFYNRVTEYVRKYYSKAERNMAVQLALIILQRRVSSSIQAGIKSLERRLKRLREILTKQYLEVPKPRVELIEEYLDAIEELDEEKIESIEEELVSLTAARTLSELKEEIEELNEILELGKRISEKPDSKLQRVLEIIRGEVSRGNKVLVFTEFRDTLDYLVKALTREGYIVASIHGGMNFEERKKQEEILKNAAHVMVATDAAGEGLNLQAANIVINYEIPWNPNKIEQRLGRVHRYGQRKDVIVYNMILIDTIEGDVLNRLFEKIEDIRKFLGSKTLDVVGSILTETDIRKLVLEAEPPDKVFEAIDERAKQLASEYKLLVESSRKYIKPREAPKDKPPPLIEFVKKWTLENGGKVYDLENAIQLDISGKTYIIDTLNPWSHKFVRELIDSYRSKPPVLGVFTDINGRSGVIYVYKLKVKGSSGVVWEGLRAYYVDPNEQIEAIPVSYIYSNLKPLKKTLKEISINDISEHPVVRKRAKEEAQAKSEELRREEREIVSMLKNEIWMEYEREVGKITGMKKDISKLIKKYQEKEKELDKRVESIRAEEPELIAVIYVVATPLRIDEEQKRIVEAAGMKAVMEYEKMNGRIPKDVSKGNLGYDIISYDPRTGEIRYIEVKSFKTTGNPELTRHEYKAAESLASTYWLYVVENALTNPSIKLIQDPVRNANIEVIQRKSYRIVKVDETRYIVKIY